MTDTISETRIERLTRVTRDMSHPNQRPRDAATLILLDRSDATPKVLLGRRHTRHAFMPDVFVFPGGRLDPADRLLPAQGQLPPEVEERLMRRVAKPSRGKARALALAAIRECFEETGLLLGAPRAGMADNIRWQDLAENSVQADLSGLHFVARAITPPRRPRRYDSRFFAADVAGVRHRVEGVTGPEAELTELAWVPIGDARQLKMPEITSVVLEELETRLRGDMSHDLPVPFYRMINRRFVCEML